ncbi:TPA: hypothetical protein EYP38_01170, partial [Candidatus Micrarchaeota archaeon]|nr:hypothetical protein [Candidatus Micrarchaeota archaeon]
MMNSPAPNHSTAWHILTADVLADRLDTDAVTGLSKTEATKRLRENGPNRLAEKPPRSPWLLLLDQFKGFL